MRAVTRLRRSPVLVRAVAGSATPWRDCWLAARMAGWAIVLSLLKHFVPVGSLARLMWREASRDRREPLKERQIVRLADWLSRGTNLTKRGACFERSLLAYRYLSAAGANPLLVVAFGKAAGTVLGHAWVEVEGEAVGERPEMLEMFEPAVRFGAQGRVADL